MQIGEKGTANLISTKAEVEFYPQVTQRDSRLTAEPMPAQATSRPSVAASISFPISAPRRFGATACVGVRD